MKTTIQFGVCIIAFLFSTALLAQTEELTVPLTSPGKPYSLDVDLLNGSITVTSYSGSEILIEAIAETPQNKMETTDNAGNGMKRISGTAGYDIIANEENNEVTVRNNSLSQTVNLNLKIPQQQVKLKLNTVNSGDIVVTNINGELEINNVTGAIRLNNISGSVVATTISAGLTVKFTSVEPDAAMAFSTLNGNIDVTFPADVKANIKLKSDMGEIYSDFDLVIDKSQPRVNRVEKTGMRQLQVEDWIYGKINGGGPEFMMKNMQGNIYIRKAK